MNDDNDNTAIGPITIMHEHGIHATVTPRPSNCARSDSSTSSSTTDKKTPWTVLPILCLTAVLLLLVAVVIMGAGAGTTTTGTTSKPTTGLRRGALPFAQANTATTTLADVPQRPVENEDTIRSSSSSKLEARGLDVDDDEEDEDDDYDDQEDEDEDEDEDDEEDEDEDEDEYDEEDEERIDKYHPEKTEPDCENYWRLRNGTRRTLSGYGYNHQFGDNDEFAPCLPRPYDSQFEGPPPLDDDDTDNDTDTLDDFDTYNNGGQPPPRPANQSTIDHAVTITISIAIPTQYENGVPLRVTNVMKEYLNSSIVKAEFWGLEYQDGRHFAIEFMKWKPPLPEGQQQDGPDSDDGNANTSIATSNTDNKDNNNNGLTLSTNDDGFRRRRRLHSNQDQPRNSLNWSATELPHGKNASILALMAVADRNGILVHGMEGSPWAWYHHTVYLLAHEKPINTNNTSDNNNNTGKPQQVNDMELMAWLQTELKRLVYDDIRLQGPLGTFADMNNYDQRYNVPNKNISFLEWRLQAMGIPVAAMAVPGKENWDSISPGVQPTTPMGQGPNGPGFTSSIGSVGARIFESPLSATFSPRQWWGLAGLIFITVTALVMAIAANEVGKRREQDELWGNLMILENAREDASFLDVGWRFAMADDYRESNNNGNNQRGHDNAAPPPQPMMLMEVYDKTGMGYRDGESILIGGFEYRSTTAALDESTAHVNANLRRSSQRYKSRSAGQSVTLFG